MFERFTPRVHLFGNLCLGWKVYFGYMTEHGKLICCFFKLFLYGSSFPNKKIESDTPCFRGKKTKMIFPPDCSQDAHLTRLWDWMKLSLYMKCRAWNWFRLWAWPVATVRQSQFDLFSWPELHLEESAGLTAGLILRTNDRLSNSKVQWQAA